MDPVHTPLVGCEAGADGWAFQSPQLSSSASAAQTGRLGACAGLWNLAVWAAVGEMAWWREDFLLMEMVRTSCDVKLRGVDGGGCDEARVGGLSNLGRGVCENGGGVLVRCGLTSKDVGLRMLPSMMTGARCGLLCSSGREVDVDGRRRFDEGEAPMGRLCTGCAMPGFGAWEGDWDLGSWRTLMSAGCDVALGGGGGVAGMGGGGSGVMDLPGRGGVWRI